MTYQYVPAQQEMAETVEWLCSMAGHWWQDESSLRRIQAGAAGYGLTRGAWISVKMDEFRGEEITVRGAYECSWFPH